MDALDYWRERGKLYQQQWRRTPAFRAQERVLFEYCAPLAFSSVLEVGCGFGRIGAVLVRKRPYLAYTGLDVSVDQLEAAKAAIPSGTFLEGAIEDLDTAVGYDLVLGVEVLMHIPPERIERAVERLLSVTRRHLVVVEWTRPMDAPGSHNWLHDYRRLLPNARRVRFGMQSLYHVTR